MNILDISILVIILFCLIRGGFRGLIKEVSSIVGVFGGFYAAYTYYSHVVLYFSKWIKGLSYQNIVSFIIIFCMVYIIISLLGVLIRFLFRVAFLGWVDRLMGACFGVMKGVLIASILLMVLTSFLSKKSMVIKQSKVSPHLVAVSAKLSEVIPDDMKKKFNTNIDGVKKAWKNYK